MLVKNNTSMTFGRAAKKFKSITVLNLEKKMAESNAKKIKEAEKNNHLIELASAEAFKINRLV